MPAFWDHAIIIIFFFYGLGFYSMGLALLVESGRASELGFARSMRLLAGFGLLHGTHEWIDMLQRALRLYYGTTLPVCLCWISLALLISSFLALLAFGEQLLARERDHTAPSWRLTLTATVWYALSAIAVKAIYNLDEMPWVNMSDVLARYIIGIPGSLLAFWALWRQREAFRRQGMEVFVRDLTIAAAALALYGIIGQFVTEYSPIFPANILNTDLFLRVTGFPIQLFRAIMAILVAVSMIRVLRALEVENQQRLESAERSKREAETLRHEELARLNQELQIANEETARLLEEVRRRDTLRGELIHNITAAQEAERQRIARELHDETGQALTGVALGLRGLTAQASQNPDLILKRLPTLETMATTALADLRHLINDLRPPQLDDMGLAAGLRWLVERFNEQNETQAALDIQGEATPLPPEIETTLFRIAQEGLTNVAKHAQAQHVRVTLDFDDGPALRVQDDGVGYQLENMLNATQPRRAWGLVGMQERANLINAALNVETSPGAGTKLTIRLGDNHQGDA